MAVTQISWFPDIQVFRSTDRGATWSRIWDWNGYPDRTLRYSLDISGAPWLDFGKQAAPPEPSPKLGWMTESFEIDPFDSNSFLYGTGATVYGGSNLTAWDTGGKVAIGVKAQGLEETAVLDLASPPGATQLISGLGDIGGFVHSDITKVPPAYSSTAPALGSITGVDFAEKTPATMVRVGKGDAGRAAHRHLDLGRQLVVGGPGACRRDRSGHGRDGRRRQPHRLEHRRRRRVHVLDAGLELDEVDGRADRRARRVRPRQPAEVLRVLGRHVLDLGRRRRDVHGVEGHGSARGGSGPLLRGLRPRGRRVAGGR